MRLTPSHKAEMVSQLVYGEEYTILRTNGEWSLIRDLYDDYEGWITTPQALESCNIPASAQQIAQQLLPTTSIEQSPSIVAQHFFLGTPYLWGGKTLGGIDCSGLTQTCFKACGKKLRRDACDQALQGIVIDSLANAQCNDLCFFANSEDKITHVGIYLDNNKIIHSSNWVRISQIDNYGILNDSLTDYTHRLFSIRRID